MRLHPFGPGDWNAYAGATSFVGVAGEYIAPLIGEVTLSGEWPWRFAGSLVLVDFDEVTGGARMTIDFVCDPGSKWESVTLGLDLPSRRAAQMLAAGMTDPLPLVDVVDLGFRMYNAGLELSAWWKSVGGRF